MSRPYLIDANIGEENNPGNAGVWELLGLSRSKPTFGAPYDPGEAGREPRQTLVGSKKKRGGRQHAQALALSGDHTGLSPRC